MKLDKYGIALVSGAALGVSAGAFAQDFIVVENVSSLAAVSADGRYVTGLGTVSQPGAFRLDTVTGEREVIGIDLTGWSLKTLQNMSDDGLSFVGAATDPMGRNVWYVARAGEPCLADLDGNGVLNIFDFIEFQNLFVTGDLRVDFDGDGELSLFDFLEFQSLFSAGC